MRIPMLLLLALGASAAAEGAPEPSPAIAVYDQQAAGGQGASVKGLVQGLTQAGYRVERIRDLSLLTLAPYDILYLSDVHHPGNAPADWRASIQAYVRAGGSVLQTWHHHILGEVAYGVERVYGSRRMRVLPGHPAVAGAADFDAFYKDHIIEKVGPEGTPLLRNDAGQVVAAAGALGKGRVISTGLALAIPEGNQSAPPRGAEMALLRAFLEWLTPAVPRAERVAALLKEPALVVSPSQVLVAAGTEAAFEVRVGAAEGQRVEVTCAGARVAPDGAPRSIEGGFALHVFRVAVATDAARGEERECVLRAAVAGRTLEEKARVESVYGKAPEDERRGVWLHVREGRSMAEVMAELKRLGINLVVPRIAGGTAAYYASKVQPDVQDPLAPGGDSLAEAVRHAHANGLEIHPYVNNCIVEGRSSPETRARLRAAGRLQEGPDARPIDWFCPSHPDNLDAMERPMVEIVTRYPVDGVQYDFIRYPNPQGCFCARCRALFEKETAKAVAQWPADVVDGARHSEWVEFRCRRISAIVERVSNAIRRAAPKVKISAAVFRNWPECREDNGQDWVRWCKEGWLDFVCPMNYTLSAGLFAERAKTHREALPAGFPVVQGIGINAGNGQMEEPRELAVQIALARKNGAAGFLGFCYAPRHTAALFEPLGEWLK